MKTPLETSPYHLIQEDLRDDPWALLVACIMLNCTTAKQVKQVLPEFFSRWQSPMEVLRADDDEMVEVLRPLGMMNRRVERIKGMTFDFISLRPDIHPEQIDNIYGVGKYAADSFRIFVLGYLVLDVLDKELRNYVEWAAPGALARGDGGVRDQDQGTPHQQAPECQEKERTE